MKEIQPSKAKLESIHKLKLVAQKDYEKAELAEKKTHGVPLTFPDHRLTELAYRAHGDRMLEIFFRDGEYKNPFNISEKKITE